MEYYLQPHCRHFNIFGVFAVNWFHCGHTAQSGHLDNSIDFAVNLYAPWTETLTVEMVHLAELDGIRLLVRATVPVLDNHEFRLKFIC